jgi:hypothetical protein
MNRVQEFLEREKEHYGKIFVDLNYSIDNVKPFIDRQRFEDRKYIKRLPVLKRYIDLIDSAENEISHRRFMDIFNHSREVELLDGYKKDNIDELKQLENCSSCKCLNCSAECKFDVCLGCRKGARVAECDHEKINVMFHDNFIVDLINEKTGRNEKYMVLATLQDVTRDKRYIIIEGISNDEKFILYYYPGISEDTYGEITDEQEFDFIVSTFESVER